MFYLFKSVEKHLKNFEQEVQIVN